MTRQRKQSSVALNVLSAGAPRRDPRRMSRRRAVALLLVHVLAALHIAHYLYAGRTLSPLEPSEAGYSLRDGAVNAGAIFLCVLILSALLFGRFFCGWACHFVAYQDAARWLLLKLGIHPRPVRMRLLFFVPLFAVFWLYGRPLLERFSTGRRVELSWELTTAEFWETFPGLTISLLTFGLAGMLIVYFLGSKGYCTYGCPYGALFGIADRAAPGRIRVTDACDSSSQCTRNCSSNVDVAREVRQFGMVINPGCLKCMDCVAGCPNNALYFGFVPRTTSKPAPRARKQKIERHYDFTWREELFSAAAFIAAFWIFYRLYRVIPFLLAVGLAVMTAYTALQLARLFYAPQVRFQNLLLRDAGRTRAPGRAFALLTTLLFAFLAHSAWIQWHTRRGAALYEQSVVAQRAGQPDDAASAALRCDAHLALVDRYGLIHTSGLGRMRGQLARRAARHDDAVNHYARDIRAETRNPLLNVYMAESLRALGRDNEAQDADRAALGDRPGAERTLRLAHSLADQREFAAQLALLRAAHQVLPSDPEIALQLCRALVASPDPALRAPATALQFAEQFCTAQGWLTPDLPAGAQFTARPHADLLAMLAWLYSAHGRHADAANAARLAQRAALGQGLTQLARDMAEAEQEYLDRAAGAAPQ